MDWLKRFKLAVISKDISTLGSLIDSLPEFSDIKEQEEALYLIREATELLNGEKSKTLLQMQQMKKNIEFLESTAKQKTNKLDVSY